MTVADRLAAFGDMGYAPHGLYIPDDGDLAQELRRLVRDAGDLDVYDERVERYMAAQAQAAQWEQSGVPGHWTGQQAIARSDKRFRFVAYGRRSGKTFHAAREALAVLRKRARSRVWVAAPTMHLVGRCFDMIVQLVRDLGIKIEVLRNTRDEKLLVIEGGSTVEGVSLDASSLEAGAAVDLAIIDEAAEMLRDAWRTVILPPLADRGGQALLISTWKGQENFFYEQGEHARESIEWAFFEDASWEVNFYSFPQGRRSAAMRAEEEEMSSDPFTFLEQFGSIPQGTRRQIYPQFRSKVHTGDYPYVPGTPVYLGIDPSSGANEYGVLACQLIGENMYFIDEYYVAHVQVEDIIPVLEHKPWIKDFKEGVADPANIAEVERWVRYGFNVFPLTLAHGAKKPLVEDRIPVYRKLLRDPFQWYPTWRKLAALILEDWGDARNVDDLDLRTLQMLTIEIEERIAEHRLNEVTIALLKKCSHIFINASTCPNFINEHRTYAYRKPRGKGDTNIPEKPRKWKDHLMDSAGYLTWFYKRFDVERGDLLLPHNYLRLAGQPDPEEIEALREEMAALDSIPAEARELVDTVIPYRGQARNFLEAMRTEHSPQQNNLLRSSNVLRKS